MLTIAILTVAGILLIAAEVYLPGGILGVLGGIALVIAVGVGFSHFGVLGGMLFAVVLFCVVMMGVTAGLQLFPKTPVGKKLTLDNALAAGSGQEVRHHLIQAEGKTVTILRPSGSAIINKKRYDVVAETGLIESDTPIRVIAVDGTKIIVRSIS